MILNHLNHENDDLEAILSDDDSEVIKGIGEADLGGFEANTGIVALSPTDMAIELSPEELRRVRNEIIAYGTDPLTSRLCMAILEHLPPPLLTEIPANLARLQALKNSGKIPGWWDPLVSLMLDGNRLCSLGKAAKALDISRFSISAFAQGNGLGLLIQALKAANWEQSVNSLEDELHDRAHDRTDKGSIPFLIFALKGGKPERYKESAQTAIQINQGPTSWSIDPVTIADKPRT